MTIQFEEYPDSRSASVDEKTQERTLHFWLSGIQDDAAARAYVDAHVPPMFDGFFARGADMDTTGAGHWDVDIRYGTAEPGQSSFDGGGSSGEVSFTFDTSGGTAHIKQARDHVEDYVNSGTAPNHGGAINVTDSGVDGTDVVIAQFSWTENWTLPISYASFAAALLFKNLTGKINALPFRGFGPGQVRFDGAIGGASSKEPTQAALSYKFVQSDDSSDAMPSFKSDIVKLGWEYIWLEYEKQEDDTAKRIIQPPIAAHVEGVYETGDFSQLGIGTGLI